MMVKKNSKTTASRNKVSAKVSQKPLNQNQLNEIIQRRAYELFEKRGFSNGNDLGDWLEAERFVKSGKCSR